MKKLTSEILKLFGLGLSIALIYSNFSCTSMTRAQKTALFGESLTILGSINTPNNNTPEGRFAKELLTVSGSVVMDQAMMQHDLEVAQAGRSQTIINNNTPGYQDQNQSFGYVNNRENMDNSTPKGFFMYKNWSDFNNDNATNRDELIGLNESVYDLHNFNRIWFSFYGGGDSSYNGQNLSLKVYSMDDGKIINYYNEIYSGGLTIKNFSCESMFFPQAGRYKAVLNVSNNRNFILNFEVIK